VFYARLFSLYSAVRTVAAGALAATLVIAAVPHPTRAAGNSMQLQHVRGHDRLSSCDGRHGLQAGVRQIGFAGRDFAVTRAQSAGVIAMPDSSLVSLGENTNVKVAAFENAAAGPGSTITLTAARCVRHQTSAGRASRTIDSSRRRRPSACAAPSFALIRQRITTVDVWRARPIA